MTEPLKPIETPEMLIMQERCFALADEMDAFAEELAADPNIEDAAYVGGMMHLSAKRMRQQGEDLEDSDDIRKVDMFLTSNELEIHRARAKMAEAKAAHDRGEHRGGFSRWITRGGRLPTLFLILAGVFLVLTGYQIGRIVSDLVG